MGALTFLPVGPSLDLSRNLIATHEELRLREVREGVKGALQVFFGILGEQGARRA